MSFFYKKNLSILFCTGLILCSAFLRAQISVGVSGHTISVSPGYTVTSGTTITVTGLIENTGTLDINDNVHVHLAVDTSSTSVPKYYWRSTRTYALANFLSTNTFSFNVTDVVSTTNGYKVAGNGATIVVWASVGSPVGGQTTRDSAFSNVYMIGVPAGVDDLMNFENSPIYFKNPITENVQLYYDENRYTLVELINASGQLMPNSIKDKILYIDTLEKGLYLLKFHTLLNGKQIIKKIVIE